VHFRGRHLHGTPVALPSTHTGAILNITDKQLPQRQPQPQAQDDEDDEDMQDQVPEEVKIAEQVGEFDSVVVWEHGTTIDEERDGFVRGMREWVGWAEAMHVDEQEEEKKGKK
jgi:ribonuclease H2 subunit C